MVRVFRQGYAALVVPRTGSPIMGVAINIFLSYIIATLGGMVNAMRRRSIVLEGSDNSRFCGATSSDPNTLIPLQPKRETPCYKPVDAGVKNYHY